MGHARHAWHVQPGVPPGRLGRDRSDPGSPVLGHLGPDHAPGVPSPLERGVARHRERRRRQSAHLRPDGSAQAAWDDSPDRPPPGRGDRRSSNHAGDRRGCHPRIRGAAGEPRGARPCGLRSAHEHPEGLRRSPGNGDSGARPVNLWSRRVSAGFRVQSGPPSAGRVQRQPDDRKRPDPRVPTRHCSSCTRTPEEGTGT